MGTTAQATYEQIRQMLAKGELPPGQRLSQIRLARKMGCSTIPVVEALRRLESEGLLVKEPRKMARVRELSPGDLEGLYLVREGLEAVAARLCARRITEAQFHQLESLGWQFDSAVQRGDSAAAGDADVAIHRLIVECAGVPLLAEELGRLMAIEQTAGWAGRADAGGGDPHRAHSALIRAIGDRDADLAEYFMKRHIQGGLKGRLAMAGKAAEP